MFHIVERKRKLAGFFLFLLFLLLLLLLFSWLIWMNDLGKWNVIWVKMKSVEQATKKVSERFIGLMRSNSQGVKFKERESQET